MTQTGQLKLIADCEREPRKLEFTVFATDYQHRGKIIHCGPEPQGSARAMNLPGKKYPVVFTDNPDLIRWRKEVKRAADAASLMAEGDAKFPIPKPWPVRVDLRFVLTAPAKCPRKRPTVKPDGDKLERAIFDALTGTLFEDDSQVVEGSWSKDYGAPERCEITVSQVAP